LAVPDRTGEDWGRVAVPPAMLDEEEEEVEEEEEASIAGLLLADRENGPGKQSSVRRGNKQTIHIYVIYITVFTDEKIILG